MQADPKTPTEPIARHLAAITREAAGRAYEADAATAGKITTWLITVLTTLHAGGFLAAIDNADKIANPFEVKLALLAGLISTISGGAVGMVHYNYLAERWRLEMHMEIEGSKEIGTAAQAAQKLADVADRLAVSLLAVSVICLGIAGAHAF
ncbi:hypothetical protein ATE67_10100 [Sphingopyxis sp. H050]|jgi:hypothetical protein|uniref:hypothetical protein n=1 Tax=Sphingopyxis sp. H050 TaxID=1759072 RepID=UPI000736EF7D|nr:hypothetical protein [Sphingopyxis sp. H050]KTE20588.1 hypothetical protein ATE67_10100 [Sphingopyxis sp. H050]